MTASEKNISLLCSFIARSQKIVVFTGAGISTESGISDYRSQGGLWEKFKPVTIQEFLADEESRREFWRRKKYFYEQMKKAEPNEGHLAIARLEVSGKMLGLITQNIDGLHHRAGSQNILEIHGTNRETICLECGELTDFHSTYARLLDGEEIPLCLKCGGLLKANTISFGQNLDPDVLEKSFAWARTCDLMIAAGSSLIVEPAASIPRIAKDNNAKLVIINRDPTPLDLYSDILIRNPIGNTLKKALVGL